jgi:HTH-type transcriptional regulator/antitoxin HigA
MAKSSSNQYVPDYLVTPGEVLEEYLDAYGMSQAELAARTGMAKKTINEIIKGKASITSDTALKLERTLGRPAHFWSNMERQYQEDRVRLAEKERLKSHLDWLKKVPVNIMANRGWIKKCEDKSAQLEEVLRFFGIASPEQWETVWREHQVAYRQTQRFATCAESVSAWLRQGAIQARRIQCGPFNKRKFLEALESIRTLTRDEPEAFEPRLTELCAAAGVAVVFVPELPKTGVSGATRWLGDKAVIQLSLRYKSNDQLWFTFYHEAGHIVKHGRKEIFIEGNGMDDAKEEEADVFAANKLVPESALRRFLEKWDRRNHATIEAFAEQIGVAPGIVVGRLQHDGLMPHSHGNNLKVPLRWSTQKAA